MSKVLILTLFALFQGSLFANDNIDQADETAEPEWFEKETKKPVSLFDVALDTLVAAGYSSVPDHDVEELQGGGHDPKRRGFTLQQVELSFSGVLESYFRADAHILVSEELFELEEVTVQTLGLPAMLKVKLGYLYSDFGHLNSRHAHTWDFVDQPVIMSRLLGPDGIRGLGLQLHWTAPLPWTFKISGGVQNANDDSMISFRGEGHTHGDDHDEDEEEHTVAGWEAVERDTESFNDLLYSFRIQNQWESDGTSSGLGISGLYGPNRTGDTGKTWIIGADVFATFNIGEESYIHVQSEFMYRYFQADGFTHEGDPLDPLDDEVFDPTVLGDWGVYGQVVYGWNESWMIGVRVDFADAARNGEFLRIEDPLRDRRLRISPLVEYEFSSYARLRVQYNFDHMQHLEKSSAHSVWLGFQMSFALSDFLNDDS
ncbi:hypothetical protein OAU50_01420 [Planctomycetota bacterium]|nr:hypothetical protein [Planctomycetota bacterium]